MQEFLSRYLEDQRSVQQNRYSWGVVMKIISDDTGQNPETIHAILKDITGQSFNVDGGLIPD